MSDNTVSITPALFPNDRNEVVTIFREYVKSPSVSLEFQDFESEFASLPGKYEEPYGCILLAWQCGMVVGCVAMRSVDHTTCELKRLYVRPAARGQNLGRALVERMIEKARDAHYAIMCLDVLPEFVTAQQLYSSLGFVPAQPVSYNPVPGTRFLGLRL